MHPRSRPMTNRINSTSRRPMGGSANRSKWRAETGARKPPARDHFSDSRKFLRRDPGGWLPLKDSNLSVSSRTALLVSFRATSNALARII